MSEVIEKMQACADRLEALARGAKPKQPCSGICYNMGYEFGDAFAYRWFYSGRLWPWLSRTSPVQGATELYSDGRAWSGPAGGARRMLAALAAENLNQEIKKLAKRQKTRRKKKV